MARLPRMTSGDTALMRAWNELVALVEPALLGPSVCPPLAVLDGTIYLAADFGIHHFIVTEVVDPLAGGNAMGAGMAKFCTPDASGVLSAGEGEAFELWNNTPGTIAVGTRGLCARVDGLWQVLQAWCQG